MYLYQDDHPAPPAVQYWKIENSHFTFLDFLFVLTKKKNLLCLFTMVGNVGLKIISTVLNEKLSTIIIIIFILASAPKRDFT